MSLQLPNVKKLGKSVSHWEIMDKFRELIKPDEFTILKVTKTTVEFVRFEAEVELRSKLERVISKIDNKMIKLKDFSELMRVRATEWKSDFPNRRVWDDFFQNAKDMDEMKPGERPDTIHLSELPSKWFVPYHLSGDDDAMPSEKIFYRIFQKFGSIRYVDIPICDPYRKKMKDQISGLKTSSFDETDFFEGYVQFKDYIGFTKVMDTFRDMKLVHKDEDSVLEVNIKVQFDKSKHMSDASIRRREIVRDRLVRKAKEKEERDKVELEEKKRQEELERQKEIDMKTQKELRRQLREEKRKAKLLEKLEISGSDEINEKIAREEKKLLKVQRKLEAIRLVEELFRRIKEKNIDNLQLYDNISNPAQDELRRFKDSSELEVLNQREKLHHAIKGRVMLKTILSDGTKSRTYSSSSSNSSLSLEPEEIPRERPRTPVVEKYPELLYDPSWYGYTHPFHLNSTPMFPEYADLGPMRGFFPRTRPPKFHGMPGPSRGGAFNRRRSNFHPRFRGNYRGGRSRPIPLPQDLEEEYQKYFAKFLSAHDDRIYMEKDKRPGSYSPSHRFHRRSRSRSASRDRSYSRSRSRSRRRSRNSKSHSNRYSRSDRTRSRSRSRSKRRSSSSRRHSRSYSNSRRSRSRTKEKSRSRGRSKSKEKSKSKEQFREKSVDSSTFMTPKQLLEQRSERRSRTKSWSLPKENDRTNDRSWSKSPEK